MPRPQIPNPRHLNLKRHLPRRRTPLQHKLAQPPQHIHQDKIRHRLAILAEVRHRNLDLPPIREFVRILEDAPGDGRSAFAVAYVLVGDTDGKGDGAKYVIDRHRKLEAVEIQRGG